MISLPTNSVATGSSARTSRTPSVIAVRNRLVRHTMARNGGRLRSAPSRSKSSLSTGAAAGNACSQMARRWAASGNGTSMTKRNRRRNAPSMARRMFVARMDRPL